jgi:hypothetical protein
VLYAPRGPVSPELSRALQPPVPFERPAGFLSSTTVDAIGDACWYWPPIGFCPSYVVIHPYIGYKMIPLGITEDAT